MGQEASRSSWAGYPTRRSCGCRATSGGRPSMDWTAASGSKDAKTKQTPAANPPAVHPPTVWGVRKKCRKGVYSVLLVDGLSMAYMILDKQMYISNIMLDTMWRHWMPASFAASVLDGEDWLCPRVREMFAGKHLGYSVANCIMLIMPLPKHGRWSVYVWDFLERDVIILDPYMQGYDESKLIIEHTGSMDRLHDALFDCKEAWFIGWDVGRNHWTFKFPNALGRPCHEAQSGAYAMHYALHFDGDRVTDLSIQDDDEAVLADQLYQMLQAPGNARDVPDFVPRSTA